MAGDRMKDAEKRMKEKITQVSIQLFEQKGFSETSIQDICDGLGVTKGTFYYYFTSKEKLLMDIHLRYIDDMLRRQERIINDPDKNSRTKLFDVVHMLIRTIERQGTSARVFFREMRHLNEERLASIVTKRNQFRINTETLLRMGVEAGEFRRNLNVKIVALGILGITNWSYQWFRPTGDMSDREVAEIFVAMILQGIASE